MAELSEQEILRRNSLEELRKLGIEPYPAELYPVNTTAKEIHKPLRIILLDVIAFTSFQILVCVKKLM